MYAGVVVELINKNIDKVFTYKIPSNLNVKIGERVLVPFGRMNLEGFVVEINDNKPDYDIKEINSLIDDEPVLNEEMLELGKYICKKTLCTLSSSYQTMLPKALKAKIHPVTLLAQEYFCSKNIARAAHDANTAQSIQVLSALINDPIISSFKIFYLIKL